jgi:Flp pilus assembly protein TadD
VAFHFEIIAPVKDTGIELRMILNSREKISPERKRLIVYLFLIVVTFAVFWQVNRYEFINLDDNIYVTLNSHIKEGITPDTASWIFNTSYGKLWNPLVWLSYMADYRLFGLKAGGYHLTNLILHILSTLLLFWLFNRMTGALWRSAFVAALFALHPMHVESVAWIAERKDVLSAFFWMLTLCFYVYYTEKPVLRRYLPVVFAFILALMSKPMVITLPLIMILLDYWPLKRFESHKGNLLLWQLKEKTPLFILSALLIALTLYTPKSAFIKTIYTPYDMSSGGFSLLSRILNAPISFVTYLVKTFWPYDLAIFYPFPSQIPVWHIAGASLVILIITAVVIATAKRLPYLFVGWMWYAATIAPVIGIIQIGSHSMADRYTYIPLIGIYVMLGWGIPSLIKSEEIKKYILFPAGICFIAVMAFLAFRQCGYWQNGITLFTSALEITRGNYVAHNNIAIALEQKGRIEEAIYHYNQSIKIVPDGVPLNNMGNIYADMGQYQRAMYYYNEAIRIRPDFADAYYNIALIQTSLKYYQEALDNYTKAINFKPTFQAYNNRGNIYNRLGRYKEALADYNNAIGLEKRIPMFYINRADAYFYLKENRQGCTDLQKACDLGNCKKLEEVNAKGLCR